MADSTNRDFKKKYEELFETKRNTTERDNDPKVKAFDKIAERFYFGNFGTMNKTDFEILMFSIYIEQILEKSEDDIKSYSDYTLSKYLGITQQKISNLKVRKELLYPREGFSWQKAFCKFAKNATYEEGKIKVFVPDKNVFLEIKNAVEEQGGFIEIQLTSNLLQVKPQYFLDLMIAIDDDSDKDALKREIITEIKEKHNNELNLDKEYYDSSTKVSDILKDELPDIALTFIGEFMPKFGDTTKQIIQSIIKVINQKRTQKQRGMSNEKN